MLAADACIAINYIVGMFIEFKNNTIKLYFNFLWLWKVELSYIDNWANE